MTTKVIGKETILSGLELRFELYKDFDGCYDIYVILNDDETVVMLNDLSDSIHWDWNGEKRMEVYNFIENTGNRSGKLSEHVGELIKKHLYEINGKVLKMGIEQFYESL